MFYHFLYPLATEWLSAFNLFRYITFRSFLAAFISVIFFILFGKSFIQKISRHTANITRKLTPDTHKKKRGTPSMGGLIILSATLISVLFTGNFFNSNVILALITLISFALLGFIDDYIKEIKKDGKGVHSYIKIVGQLLISFSICTWLYYNNPNEFLMTAGLIPMPSSAITIPFISGYFMDIKLLYIPLGMFIFVATSNAVNLTDGLDGLATGNSLFVLLFFAGITYLSGHQGIAQYLKIPYSPYIGELTIVIVGLSGACLGFLWFNSHPAQIFMGDTGSLCLGGFIGLCAILLKVELLLPIVGGVFVIEALSVIVQVLSYKIRKKRIFRMAPIHHHFELKGWHENKIITRMWIAGIMLALVGLASFKIR